ncbi:MAG: carboxymuconolactone decarboxylase family protein [Solirubrobacterales bacterium]
MERFSEVTGEEGVATLRWLDDVAPDLGRYVVEWGYADVYSRPGLDLQRRQIATLAALVTQGGAEAQLRIHIAAALRLGLDPREIVEIILQCLPFTGFPRVLNATGVAREVFAAEGIDDLQG